MAGGARRSSSGASTVSHAMAAGDASAPGPEKAGSPAPQPPTQPAKSLDAEITAIAVPMLIALATDPIAGLVDTALIGRIGAVELAGLGVGLSIFNTITKFLNVPLVSATTTAVAEAVGLAQSQPTTIASVTHDAGSSPQGPAAGTSEARTDDKELLLPKGQGAVPSSSSAAQDMEEGSPIQIKAVAALEVEAAAPSSKAEPAAGHPAATETASLLHEAGTVSEPDAVATASSSALVMALIIGIVEALVMFALSPHAVHFWGLAPGTLAHQQGTAFLQVRALTAPFTVLMLTLQGIFRGLTDTRTPLVASLVANLLNVGLAPLLIFVFGWGVRGAAAAVGLSQVLPCLWLLWQLSLRTNLMSVQGAAMQHLLMLLKPSGLLLLRTAAVTTTYAYATSVVARSGPVYAAAHQVAFSLWLSTTLLADSLAVAAQSLLATKAAAGNILGARQAAVRCVQLGGGLGLLTAAVVALFRHPIAHVFSHDAGVLEGVATVMPLLIVTQPINALAFVWDGVLFGAGGFRYASLAMAACAIPACALIHFGASATPAHGLLWVWGGLSTLMLCRAVSIYVPWAMKAGPFHKLKGAAGEE